MTDQEIRAKALEIAVCIIGEKDDAYKIVTDTNTAGRMKAVSISLLDHYRPLASEIEEYIREASAGKKPV